MRPSNLFHIGETQNNHLTIKPERTVRSSPPTPPPPSLSLSISAPFHGYSKLHKATRKENKSREGCGHAWESNSGPPAQNVIVIKSRHLLALSRFFTDRNDDFPILHILQLVKSLLFQGDVCAQAIISWSSVKRCSFRAKSSLNYRAL